MFSKCSLYSWKFLKTKKFNNWSLNLEVSSPIRFYKNYFVDIFYFLQLQIELKIWVVRLWFQSVKYPNFISIIFLKNDTKMGIYTAFNWLKLQYNR